MANLDLSWAALQIANARIAELEQLLAAAERERDVARLKARIVDRFPFCPDHRDKVAGKACRECEIERLTRERDDARKATDDEHRLCLDALHAFPENDNTHYGQHARENPVGMLIATVELLQKSDEFNRNRLEKSRKATAAAVERERKACEEIARTQLVDMEGYGLEHRYAFAVRNMDKLRESIAEAISERGEGKDVNAPTQHP